MPRSRDFVIALALVVFAFTILLSPCGRRISEPPVPRWDPAFDPETEITGFVVDERGYPLAGARVRCDLRPFGRCVLPGSDLLRPEAGGPEAITDEYGGFRLAVGRNGIADLCIRPPRHGETMLARRRAGDRLKVRVTEGANLLVTVTDPAHTPLADARVYILKVLAFRKPLHWHSGVTDREGRFAYGPLTAGDVLLEVHHSTFGRDAPVRVTIPRSGAIEAKVVLYEGRGRPAPERLPAWDRPCRGSVLDPGGRPVPDAAVVLGDRTTTTDDGGRFEFPAPPVPPVLLIVWADGLGRSVQKVDDWPAPTRVRLVRGVTVSGRAAPDAVVELSAGLAGDREIAIADATGSFRFRDVAPGSFRVTVLPVRGPTREEEIEVPAGVDVTGLDLSTE